MKLESSGHLPTGDITFPCGIRCEIPITECINHLGLESRQCTGEQAYEQQCAQD